MSIFQAGAQALPAVSAPNGKFEFDAGALSLPSPSFMTRAAGAVTLPLGERFGLQVDASVASAPGFTASAALHLFTRDPQSYLIGGTLGIVRTPGALVVAAGPEAELYLDRWTIEAWAGVSSTHPVSGPIRVAPFVMAGLGYYLTENARITLGAASLDGYGTVQLSGEYLFDQFDLPLALTAETRIGQDGAWRGMLGLRAYIAGTRKTLMARHREDDPADRGSALYSSIGGKTVATSPKPSAAAAPTLAPAQPPAAEPQQPLIEQPAEQQPPEAQPPEIQQPETQPPAVQQPEGQQPEQLIEQPAEQQPPEARPPEIQQPEAQPPAVQQPEGQQPEQQPEEPQSSASEPIVSSQPPAPSESSEPTPSEIQQPESEAEQPPVEPTCDPLAFPGAPDACY